MLTKETESLFAKVLMSIAEKERSVDITRQVIADYSDFDPYQLFVIIDAEGKRCINASNVIEFLRRNGIYASLTEVSQVILFYDEDADGFLSLGEWVEMIVCEKDFALKRDVMERAGTYTPLPELSFNVEYAVVKYLEKELELARSVLELMEEAKRQKDFDVHGIFHRMTMGDKVGFEEMKRFLEGNYFVCSKDDVRYIMKRADIDNDGRVGLDDLHRMITFPNNPWRCTGRFMESCECLRCCSCCLGRRRGMEEKMDRNEECVGQKRDLNGSYERNKDRKNNDDDGSNECNKSKNKKEITRNYQGNNDNQCNVNDNNKGTVLQNHYNMKISLPKTSPKRTDPINKSPIRYHSPPKNPIRNHSPQCNSPHHSSCCHHCHCSPCQCCKLSYSTNESHFLSYIREMMHNELQIEQTKKELALRADFNLEDTFQFFSSSASPTISEASLKFGLEQLTLSPSSSDLTLLINRSTLNQSNSITYNDLLNLLIPYDKGYRSMVETRRPSYLSSHTFRSEAFLPTTKQILQKLLHLIMKTEAKLQKQKTELLLSNAHIRMLFNDIDRYNQGRYNEDDWKNYLIRKGVLCSDEESLFAFNRIDYNCNGYIDYYQFQSYLQSMTIYMSLSFFK